MIPSTEAKRDHRPARPLRDHATAGGREEIEDVGQIVCYGPIPTLVSERLSPVPVGLTDDVDTDIDTTEFRYRLVESVFNLRSVCHIRNNREGLPTRGLDL